MSELLKEPFEPAHRGLPEIRDFHCGDEIWESAEADWIAGRREDDALADMHRWGTQVWLYYTIEEGIVGFGSLGRNSWPLEAKPAPRTPISIIPNLAIGSRFWKKPEGEGDGRFSHQLLQDLIRTALLSQDRWPYLGLYVDTRNTKAKGLYEKFRFREVVGRILPDSYTGGKVQAMLLPLRPASEAH